jgi:quinol monooxygenase YgiN
MTTFTGPTIPASLAGKHATRIGSNGRGQCKEEATMILGTVKVDDYDRFWSIFSTKGAELRKEHGSKGAQVFRDPDDANRVYAVLDWDEEGWQSYLSDPRAAEVFKEGGLHGPPETIAPSGKTDA